MGHLLARLDIGACVVDHAVAVWKPDLAFVYEDVRIFQCHDPFKDRMKEGRRLEGPLLQACDLQLPRRQARVHSHHFHPEGRPGPRQVVEEHGPPWRLNGRLPDQLCSSRTLPLLLVRNEILTDALQCVL